MIGSVWTVRLFPKKANPNGPQPKPYCPGGCGTTSLRKRQCIQTCSTALYPQLGVLMSTSPALPHCTRLRQSTGLLCYHKKMNPTSQFTTWDGIIWPILEFSRGSKFSTSPCSHTQKLARDTFLKTIFTILTLQTQRGGSFDLVQTAPLNE